MTLLTAGHKVSFVGDSNVGKTSIITRFYTSDFDPTTMPTIGVSNNQVAIPLGDKKIHLNIWDTAGQERFRSLVPIYTRDANCIVVVFDMSQKESFDSLNQWLENVRDEVGYKVPVVVVGNKSDLEPSVSIAECKRWCDERGLQVFFTSASTGSNINELFIGIAQIVSRNKDMEAENPGVHRLVRSNQSKSCC